MEFGDTLTILNLGGLLIVGFMSWVKIGSIKQELLGLLNRDLAEVRRQIRNTGDRANRQDDQIADNHEKILMIEVNLASMQDELETMSRKLAELLPPGSDEDGEAAESELVPPSEQRHLSE